VLGLEAKPEVVHSEEDAVLRDDEVEGLIQQRQEARNAKNWAESDRLRDILQGHGISLIDQPGGVTRWHRS